MFYWFIRHQWKEALRSSIWQKNLATNIFIGIIVVLMFLYLLLLGLFIDVIFRELFPDSDPIDIFNGILIYYFIADLFIRYLMQHLPTLAVESYLHLPVKKSAILHFVVSKSLVNVLNYLPLLVFVPFAFKVVNTYYPGMNAIAWLLSLILLVLSNNFFAVYLKRQLAANAKIVGITGIVLIAIFLFDYFHLLSLSSFSAFLFNRLLQYPVFVFVPVIFLILSYNLNYYFLRNRLYPEEINAHKIRRIEQLSRISYLKNLGITGDLISLELRLWLRHKRTKSVLYMLPLFLLYGLFFYPQEIYRESPSLLIFVGVFMSGGMMINYTNYAFGWESRYFDILLTSGIEIKKYVTVKLMLSMLICTFCFVLTIPYIFFGLKIFYINLATYFYNIGCLVFLMLYMATFNKKRMDLSKGAAFNYQGIGASNWVAMIPAFLLPVIIYLPFKFSGIPITGIIIIGILGLSGIVFYKYWLELISRQFLKRKYLMAEGFRSK